MGSIKERFPYLKHLSAEPLYVPYDGPDLTPPSEFPYLFESEEERQWMMSHFPAIYKQWTSEGEVPRLIPGQKKFDGGKDRLKKLDRMVERERCFIRDFGHLSPGQREKVRAYVLGKACSSELRSFAHLLPPNFIANNKKRYKPKLLKPDRPQRQPVDAYATIDIEAQSWTKFICGGIYTKVGKEDQYIETPNLRHLMLECFRFADEFGCVNFLAHFGGKFDFLHFLSELATNPLFVIDKMIPRSSAILSIEVGLNEEECLAQGVPYTDIQITFRDSFALLPFSLGNLTKTFKTEAAKGEVDYDFIEAIYNNDNYQKIIVSQASSYTAFLNGKQLRQKRAEKMNVTELRHIRYWNHERHKFTFAKKKFFQKYNPKKDKKDPRLAPFKMDPRTWLDEVTFPIYKKSDLLDYLFRDCKGLYQVIEKFYDSGFIKFAKKSWTAAGQAVNVYRLFMPRALHSLPDSEEFREGNVDAFVRKAYFGGRTEVFKPIFDPILCDAPWLYYADVNSLYPTVMEKNPFPDRFKGWGSGENDYNAADMAIWHVEVDVPEDMYAPPLGIKHDNKLLFPTGRFKGHFTKYEIEYAKSLGVKVLEYYEGAVLENAGFIFKNYIQELYAARLKAKESGDEVTQTSVKLCMNSTYGRMGMNKTRSNLVMDMGRNGVRLLHELDLNGQKVRIGEVDADMSKAFSNASIACYVTSYARVHLHKEMLAVGPEHVYYCDTDSLFSKKEMRFGKELGEMKLEYRIRSACFLAPKTYVNEGIIHNDGEEVQESKVVMKGFDYKKVKGMFRVSDFVNYLHGDNTKIFVEQEPKFASLKSALRLGSFLEMMNDPETLKRRDARKEAEYKLLTGKEKRFLKDEYKKSIKALKSTYDKRVIINDGLDTRPLIMGKDIIQEEEKLPIPFELKGHFF